MKPQNKYQKRIFDLFKRLPGITKSQDKWMRENSFENKAYATKKTAWCTHCGAILDKCSNKKKVVCPHCKSTLLVMQNPKRTYKSDGFVTIITTIEDFQVFRHFHVKRLVRKGCTPFVSCYEVTQNWLDMNGKCTTISRNIVSFNYIEHWSSNPEMSIKKRNYEIFTDNVYPRVKLLPTISRNGFNKQCLTIPLVQQARMILVDKEAEMLVKNKQFDLLGYKRSKSYAEYTMPYHHAIKIANRSKYIVNDASMWYDYLELLEFFDLDTHNAHYVCPADLKAEHDRLLKKKSEEEVASIMGRYQKKYQQDKGIYFGIQLASKDIVVTVIPTIAEMKEEGDCMHHCVYKMEYYKKENSLILSAKNTKGERLETIELDLRSFRILQSRGKFNTNTEHHDEIIKLVENNIAQFKDAKNSKQSA